MRSSTQDSLRQKQALLGHRSTGTKIRKGFCILLVIPFFLLNFVFLSIRWLWHSLPMYTNTHVLSERAIAGCACCMKKRPLYHTNRRWRRHWAGPNDRSIYVLDRSADGWMSRFPFCDVCLPIAVNASFSRLDLTETLARTSGSPSSPSVSSPHLFSSSSCRFPVVE
jgi:hypothetical protein